MVDSTSFEYDILKMLRLEYYNFMGYEMSFIETKRIFGALAQRIAIVACSNENTFQSIDNYRYRIKVNLETTLEDLRHDIELANLLVKLASREKKLDLDNLRDNFKWDNFSVSERKLSVYLPKVSIIECDSLLRKRIIFLSSLVPGYSIGSLEEQVTGLNVNVELRYEMYLSALDNGSNAGWVFFILPAVLVEGFQRCSNLVTRSVENFTGRLFITGAGWWTKSTIGFVSNAMVKKGIPVLGIQHGGNYGELAPSSQFLMEKELTDSFLGWSSNFDMRKISCQRFGKVKLPRKGLHMVDKVLYVSTFDSELTYQYNEGVASRNFSNYRTNQIEFWKKLVNTSVNVALKDYNIHGLKDDLEFKLMDEGIPVAMERRSIKKSAQDYDLIIIDYLGSTVLHEILRLGVPFVTVDMIESTQMNSEFERMMGEWRKFNLFFASGEELLHFLEKKSLLISNVYIKQLKDFVQSYSDDSVIGLFKGLYGN